MKGTLLATFTILIALILPSCKKWNREEAIPSYIRLNTPLLYDLDSTPMTDDARLSDIWVLGPQSLVGVYEFPTTFPIIAEGTTNLTFFAGVRENGISNTRVVYPFFTDYRFSPDLQPTQTSEVRPFFGYRTDIEIPFSENGESALNRFVAGPFNRTGMGRTGVDSLVYRGDSSVIIHLTDELNYLEYTSRDFYSLPANTGVWMELVFRSDIAITVGLDVYSSGIDIRRKSKVVANPSPDRWNRIYVNFTLEVSEEGGQAVLFKPFIAGVLPTGSGTGQVLLDNIRLIHFD